MTTVQELIASIEEEKSKVAALTAEKVNKQSELDKFLDETIAPRAKLQEQLKELDSKFDEKCKQRNLASNQLEAKLYTIRHMETQLKQLAQQELDEKQRRGQVLNEILEKD